MICFHAPSIEREVYSSLWIGASGRSITGGQKLSAPATLDAVADDCRCRCLLPLILPLPPVLRCPKIQNLKLRTQKLMCDGDPIHVIEQRLEPPAAEALRHRKPHLVPPLPEVEGEGVEVADGPEISVVARSIAVRTGVEKPAVEEDPNAIAVAEGRVLSCGSFESITMRAKTVFFERSTGCNRERLARPVDSVESSVQVNVPESSSGDFSCRLEVGLAERVRTLHVVTVFGPASRLRSVFDFSAGVSVFSYLKSAYRAGPKFATPRPTAPEALGRLSSSMKRAGVSRSLI